MAKLIDTDKNNRGVSLYDAKQNFLSDVKYTGYDYSKTLMQKNVSVYLFSNPKVRDFLPFLNDICVSYIETVKKLRVYYNFTVKKDYKKIN